MRITKIRTRQVDLALPEPFCLAWEPGRVQTHTRVVYLRIDTDEGIHGIASHKYFGAEEQCVQRVSAYLVGQDPLAIEKHAATLRYLWPYFGAAVWFIEVALWDILGKVAGLPVYRLLGGASQAVPAYAATARLRAPADRAEDARRLQAEGFRAIKLRIHDDSLQADVAQVEAVRKAVGDGMAIMVDANQADVHDAPLPGPHWNFHRALETARALAEYGVEWLEEPLPRHDYENLRRLRAASPVPIAGGENNQCLPELQRLLLDGCYDILQPDVTLSEGFLRLRALAIMAHAACILVNPHTSGSPLGTVANLHLAAAIPNTSYFEFPHDPPVFASSMLQQTLKNPLVVKDGLVQVPQGPGLGVELQDWIFD